VFATVKGGRVSERFFRGRMTVIALVATYDTASHAQALFLKALVKHYTPRINAMLLVLEPPHHKTLVEAYAESLELRFPVAMADAATVAGDGPFPGLHHVPSVVILDREGREVWRKIGLVDEPQMAHALDSL
jgi:hypothetical protein